MVELKNVDFLRLNELELITLGVKCSRCGHTWGIRLKGKTDLREISLNFFICENCVRIVNTEPANEAISTVQ